MCEGEINIYIYIQRERESVFVCVKERVSNMLPITRYSQEKSRCREEIAIDNATLYTC